MKNQTGSVVLLVSMFMLSGMSALAFVGVNYGVSEQKIYVNQQRADEAFLAAQSGLDYGAVYFIENKKTLLVDSDGNGFMNPVTLNVTLDKPYSANAQGHSTGAGTNPSFELVFSNPISGNLNLISVESTGYAMGGLYPHTVKKLFVMKPTLAKVPDHPVLLKGGVSLSGNASVVNTDTDMTIKSGGSITFQGSASTVTSGGTSSNSSTQGNDLTENDPALAAISEAALFSEYFGTTKETIKSQATIVHEGQMGNYNSLEGVAGELIWLSSPSGTVNMDGNTTIGTPENPVILVVDSNLNLSGGVEIYGVLYVNGHWTGGSGGVKVHGALVVAGDLDTQSDVVIDYEKIVMGNIPKNGQYMPVLSSWNDMGY